MFVLLMMEQAATLSRMLSAIPLSATGPAQLTILDIHALQELFYFSDNVLVCHNSLNFCLYPRYPQPRCDSRAVRV